MHRVIFAVGGCLIVLSCILIALGGYLLLKPGTSALMAGFPSVFGGRSNTAGVTPTETQSQAGATIAPGSAAPPVVPADAATSTPQVSNPTLDELLGMNVPRNDPIQVTERLKAKSGTFATPTAPKLYNLGDQTTFWVSRDITGTNELITATLRYVTPHAYLWAENGNSVGDAAFKSAGDAFENKVYPTDRKNYGSEWTPGIDNDPHIYILNTHFDQAIAGYYSSADEYPTFANPYSNQHELIYINLRDMQPGTEGYTSVLSHEFGHMIHWNENKREGSWITEGFGMLAQKLNGFPQDVSSFVENPDLQLDAWAPLGQSIPHYEASYLFLSYLLNRFGDPAVRDMIASGTHDIFTVQKALDQVAPGLKFDDVFADWTAANYVNDKSLGTRYSYLDRDLGIRPQFDYSHYPVDNQGQINQYGTDYIALDPGGHDVTLTFDGRSTVPVIPTNPRSGKSMWWGNRVDQSDTTLTHEFDLGGVTRATLKFWTWYDLESDFDYAYVEVSTDGGQTWKTLPGRTTTTRNPNGANYGNGLTCKSVSGCDRDAPPAQWVQEQMDLTPFAGKKILLRFEYITDAIYTGAGVALDDIQIPELNFSDDVENGVNGWQASGFARIDNQLPQRFLLQAIEYGAGGQPVKIVPIALDAKNHATYTTSGLGKSLSQVVIVISAATPITWEKANYSYTIQ